MVRHQSEGILTPIPHRSIGGICVAAITKGACIDCFKCIRENSLEMVLVALELAGTAHLMWLWNWVKRKEPHPSRHQWAREKGLVIRHIRVRGTQCQIWDLPPASTRAIAMAIIPNSSENIKSSFFKRSKSIHKITETKLQMWCLYL